MNVVDFVIVIALALGAIGGFRQGFILEVATILGSIIALTAARAEYGRVRDFLVHYAPHSSWLTAISYMIVFLVVWGVIVILARLVRRAARLLFLGWADRLGGVMIGLLQAALVLELLIYLGRRLPNHELHVLINHARLTPTFLDIIPLLDKLFPHVAK